KWGDGSSRLLRARRSPANPSSPYTMNICAANTAQNTGSDSGRERASAGNEGSKRGTVAAAATANAAERTSADFKSLTGRITPQPPRPNGHVNRAASKIMAIAKAFLGATPAQ